MNRRSFLVAGAAAVAMPFCARAAGAPTVGDLKGDAAIVRQALALHPGLLRYNSPAQIAAGLDRFERDFLAAPDTERRYLALTGFLATLRCGHSYASFFNQKKLVADALFDRPTRLPFTFTWIGDTMVVLGDQSGTGILPRGAVVTAINGVAPGAMLARMLPITRADGHNDGKRRALLSVRGTDSIETFDVFHGLLYGAPVNGAHRIAWRAAGADRDARAELPALTLKARQAFQPPQSERNSTTPLWSWVMRPDGIALLTMPGWAVYNSKWDWQAWLTERLDSLSGAKGLIIDLRDNEGGNDCGDPILARLIDRDLIPQGYQQRLRYQRTPAAIDAYLDSWDDSFRTMGVGAKPLGAGFFLRPNGQEALTIKPQGKRLALPVAALIGPQNSSATFQFAQKARAGSAVRLYGGTTGGNRRGINGGAFFFVRLPASGLEFDLPLVGYFATTPQPDAGVAPDIAVSPTIADIKDGRDPVMARAVGDMLRG